MTETKKSLKRTLIGKVVSDKRAKTVTVLVERRVKHALYGKIVGKSSKYHAHDEQGEYHMGDVIEITSRVATIHAVTQASDKVRRGVISMSHAWGSDDAGKDEVHDQGGSTNRLIDDAVDMDPITGMPVQSAIPVRVSAA